MNLMEINFDTLPCETLAFFYFLAFFFGASIGSFSNVCIFRWLNPNHGDESSSVLHEPSHCFTCHTPIKWYDNIPILSYLLLRGKCRNCHTHISLQYPAVELLAGLLFLVIFYRYHFSFECLQLMVLTWLFLVATVTDIKERIIPNELILAGCAFIPILYFFNPNPMMDVTYLLIGLFFPSLFLLFLSIILELAMGIETAIGGGDIKFLFVIGGIMGGFFPATIFILGCILSSIIYSSFLIEKYFRGNSYKHIDEQNSSNKTNEKEKEEYDNHIYIPMMVGFSIAYLYALLTYYLETPLNQMNMEYFIMHDLLFSIFFIQ